MKKSISHLRSINNLFKPYLQGLATYDLTYVTSRNNEVKNKELLKYPAKDTNKGKN